MTASLRTLVLSSGYEPIKIISWQRAISLLTLGKCEIVEEYDQNIRSVSLVIKAPAIIRLLGAFRRHKSKAKFSRINIFARDKYKCQYCGKKKSINELTFDHVIPRSQGGRTFWGNILSSCYGCNSKKRDRTPEQANMKPLSQPVQPDWLPVVVVQLGQGSIPDMWASYLYWTSALTD